MPTEMELTLEQTQQGVSYEVSVDPHGSEGYLKMMVEVPDSSWLTRSIVLERITPTALKSCQDKILLKLESIRSQVQSLHRIPLVSDFFSIPKPGQ
ncbi:hypothetical protein Tco_0580410 [Tanacetum coccineum]